MTLESLRAMCRALPGVTEDIKWGHDLVFSIGGRMFAVVCLEPPHTLSFKCRPEEFAELIERDGVVPAPYLARAMWVQEEEVGAVLERPELARLIRTSYELVLARLPKSRQPGAAARAKRRVRARASKRGGGKK